MQFQSAYIDSRRHPWVALTAGGVGILARCITASHDDHWIGNVSITLRFVEHVVEMFYKKKLADEHWARAVLVKTAIDSIQNTSAGIMCTAWFPHDSEYIFLSCGTSTLILVTDGGATEILPPHSLAATLKAQGQTKAEQGADFIATHLLGQNCEASDIRFARVRSDSNATVVIAADVRLARALISLPPAVSDVQKNIRTYLASQQVGDHTHCVFISRTNEQY